MELSIKQKEVLKSLNNNRITLVKAPPGTGKTFTAVNAALQYIQDDKKRLGKVLILTFSKNARAQIVKQMDILKTECDVDIKNIEITNYHAFYQKYIWAYSRFLGLTSNLTLVSEYTRKNQIRKILEDLGVNDIKDSQIKWAIDLLEGDFKPTKGKKFNEINQIYNLKEKIIEGILELNKQGLIYFSDFGYYMNALLIKSSNLLKVVRNKYKLIILDEYQDSSNIQEDIVKSLIGKKNKALFFADENQRIYEWRGASSDRLDSLKCLYDAELNIINLTEVFRYKNKPDIQQIITEVLESKYDSDKRINSDNIKYIDIPSKEKINLYNRMVRNKCYSSMKYKLLETLKKCSCESIGILTRGNDLIKYIKKDFILNFKRNIREMNNNNEEQLVIEQIIKYIGEDDYRINNNCRILLKILSFILYEKKFGKLNLEIDEQLNYEYIKNIRHPMIKELRDSATKIDALESFKIEALNYLKSVKKSNQVNNNVYNLIKKVLLINKIDIDKANSIFLEYQYKQSFKNIRGEYILNVHQSKGREFDTVIIIDSRSIEKDKNLFYVALSRAKENIIMIDWIEV